MGDTLKSIIANTNYEELAKFDIFGSYKDGISYGSKNLLLLLSGIQDDKPSPQQKALNYRLRDKIISCYPLPEDSEADFAKLFHELEIPRKRLVEVVFLQSKWEDHLAYAYGIEEFSRIYRFISSLRWGRCEAIDIRKVYEDVGQDTWQLFVDGIKNLPHSSSSKILRILKVITPAMQGKMTTRETMDQITELNKSKHWLARDYYLALGLIPLASEPDRLQDIIQRYQFIKEYLRESKHLHGDHRSRNESSGRCALTYLAYNSGFTKTESFELFIEGEAIKDLASGPVEIEVEGHKICLLITDQGEPKILVQRNDILLKSIPAKLKDNENVIRLKERVKQIKRQTSRIRAYLENAMCNAREFSVDEYTNLLKHPIFYAMMRNLVFITPYGAGYPSNKNNTLVSVNQIEFLIDPNCQIRIAHPYDLLKSGEWSNWQHDCFVNARIQPCKQIFREVYVVTEAEKNIEHESHRFAGQLIDNKKTYALFTARDWDFPPGDDDLVQPEKAFVNQKIIAVFGTIFHIFANYQFPIGTVHFERFYESSGNKIALEDVPPIVFSETMRDVDLVAIKAYAGESAWESSTSTIESRSALVRETCLLFHLENVKIDGNFVIVNGNRASYKIHLGSGSIHQIPGNNICIVPDSPKHEEKIFLPFIDKDQMTSVILSKMLLLAHDEEITDPIILDQISENKST